MTDNEKPDKEDSNQPPVDGPGEGESGDSGTGDTSQDQPGGGSGTDGKQSPK